MTRVGIIGSSQMGALRRADAQISQAFPSLVLGYFGLPGARFSAAKTTAQGIFQPDGSEGASRRIALRINGQAEINLTQFDTLFVVGPRFFLQRFLRFCTSYDIAEWPRSGGLPLVSEALFCATLKAITDESAANLFAQFGTHRPVTVAAAAFPSNDITQSNQASDAVFAAMAKNPNAARFFECYVRAIEAALARVGYGFVMQPQTTISAPFTSEPRYLRGAHDLHGKPHDASDLRHMNTNYGFTLFRKFAEEILGISAKPTEKIP